MIEKILDRYYAKKLINKLLHNLAVYCVDKRIKFNKHSFSLEIKNKKYEDIYYKTISIISYSECFDIYVNSYESLLKDITKLIIKECNN